jgi:hypothetical protein
VLSDVVRAQVFGNVSFINSGLLLKNRQLKKLQFCPETGSCPVYLKENQIKNNKKIYRILYLSIKFSASVLVRLDETLCYKTMYSDDGTNLNFSDQ